MSQVHNPRGAIGKGINEPIVYRFRFKAALQGGISQHHKSWNSVAAVYLRAQNVVRVDRRVAVALSAFLYQGSQAICIF